MGDRSPVTPPSEACPDWFLERLNTDHDHDRGSVDCSSYTSRRFVLTHCFSLSVSSCTLTLTLLICVYLSLPIPRKPDPFSVLLFCRTRYLIFLVRFAMFSFLLAASVDHLSWIRASHTITTGSCVSALPSCTTAS
jgi:hypothetical protein